MLISLTIMVMVGLSLFSIILGSNYISSALNVGVDNISLINGNTTTFLVEAQDVIFQIDTSSLINAGIALLATVILVATITGVSVLGSGLNPQSAKIIITLTAFIGLWATLSLIVFPLIIEIAIFGSIIYIGLTIGYSIGVYQQFSGSE